MRWRDWSRELWGKWREMFAGDGEAVAAAAFLEQVRKEQSGTTEELLQACHDIISRWGVLPSHPRGRGWWLSADEIRDLLGLPLIDGDELFVTDQKKPVDETGSPDEDDWLTRLRQQGFGEDWQDDNKGRMT